MTNANTFDVSDIWQYNLIRGPSIHPSRGACMMDAVSWFQYGHLGDKPQCVNPIIREICVCINDTSSDEDRQKLKPYIFKVIEDDARNIDKTTKYRARLFNILRSSINANYISAYISSCNIDERLKLLDFLLEGKSYVEVDYDRVIKSAEMFKKESQIKYENNPLGFWSIPDDLNPHYASFYQSSIASASASSSYLVNFYKDMFIKSTKNIFGDINTKIILDSYPKFTKIDYTYDPTFIKEKQINLGNSSNLVYDDLPNELALKLENSLVKSEPKDIVKNIVSASKPSVTREVKAAAARQEQIDFMVNSIRSNKQAKLSYPQVKKLAYV